MYQDRPQPLPIIRNPAPDLGIPEQPDYYLFTDGSGSRCGPAGWSAVIIDMRQHAADSPTATSAIAGAAEQMTIGRTEAVAILEGLAYIRDHSQIRGRPLHVVAITDSEYCALLLEGQGTPSKNLDIWAALAELQSEMLVQGTHRSRNTHPCMELADRVSKQMRTMVKAADLSALALPTLIPAAEFVDEGVSE